MRILIDRFDECDRHLEAAELIVTLRMAFAMVDEMADVVAAFKHRAQSD